MLDIRPRHLALLFLLAMACSEPAPAPPPGPRNTLKVPSRGYKGLSHPAGPEDMAPPMPFCGTSGARAASGSRATPTILFPDP